MYMRVGALYYMGHVNQHCKLLRHCCFSSLQFYNMPSAPFSLLRR